MSVLIRPAHLGDGGEACQTFLRSVRTLGAAAYTPEQLNAWVSGMTPLRLEKRLLATVSFVAVAEGRIVGFSSLDVAHEELDFLYVHPTYVGQGIGRQLSNQVEDAARLRSIGRLNVVASLNAEPVYLHLGYEKERDMVKTIDGIRVACIRMSKALF